MARTCDTRKAGVGARLHAVGSSWSSGRSPCISWPSSFGVHVVTDSSQHSPSHILFLLAVELPSPPVAIPLRHPVSHKPEEDNGIPLRHPLLHTLLFETATTRLLRHHSNDGHRKAAKKPRRSPPGSMAPQSAEARLWRARVRPASVSGSARPSRSAVAHPCLRLDGAANSLQFSKQKDKKASIKTMHGSAPVRATPSLCRLASFDPRLAGRRALVSMP